jgi:hypothetical protein
VTVLRRADTQAILNRPIKIADRDAAHGNHEIIEINDIICQAGLFQLRAVAHLGGAPMEGPGGKDYLGSPVPS